MEHREDGLMVDFSGNELTNTGQRQGNHAVVYNAKQEKELATLDQETALMRAFNEIRDYTPKKMTSGQRKLFDAMCEKIFAKHGITPDKYAQYFGHLGTADQCHR